MEGNQLETGFGRTRLHSLSTSRWGVIARSYVACKSTAVLHSLSASMLFFLLIAGVSIAKVKNTSDNSVVRHSTSQSVTAAK